MPLAVERHGCAEESYSVSCLASTCFRDPTGHPGSESKRRQGCLFCHLDSGIGWPVCVSMQEDSRGEAYFAHWPSPAKPSASAAAACPPARARYGVRRFCHRPIYILLWQTRRTLRTLSPTPGRSLRPCLLAWSGMVAQRDTIAYLAWRQLASGTRLATQVLNQRYAKDPGDGVSPPPTLFPR